MGRIVVMLGFGAMVFAAAAGGSWWWTSQQQRAVEAGSGPTAPPIAAQPVSLDVEDALPPPAGDELPVAVRPRPMSVEELLRFGMGLNQREEAVKQREEAVQQQQLQLKLVLADLKGEQESIEGLRSHIQQQLQAADGILRKIEEARSKLAADQLAAQEEIRTIQNTRIEIEDSARENIKTSAEWMQSMEPEKAAEVLREMANDGRMETAVKLLSQLEDRDVAKILSALDDAKLVDQFIERFHDLKRPPKRTSRR